MDFSTIFNLVLSCLAVSLTIWFWILAKKQNKEIKSNIDENADLIRRTTDLMKVSEEIGIVAAYPNRKEALSKFREKYLNKQRLIIIGSSLKGIKEQIDGFEIIVSSRVEQNLQTRILLTHPCYSPLREEKEARDKGEIRSEIENMINILKDWGLEENNIRLYLGTPTNFCIITEDNMVINPYPYQLQSFQSFCLEVDRKPIHDISDFIIQNIDKKPVEIEQNNSGLGAMEKHYRRIVDEKRWDKFVQEISEHPNHNFSRNISNSIYGQYYWYHYLLPWYSEYSISAKEYFDKCIDVEDCAQIRSMRTKCFIMKETKKDKLQNIEDNKEASGELVKNNVIVCNTIKNKKEDSAEIIN